MACSTWAFWKLSISLQLFFTWYFTANTRASFFGSKYRNCRNNATDMYSSFASQSVCFVDEPYIPEPPAQILYKTMAEWERVLMSSDQVIINTFPIDLEKGNFVRQVQNVLFSAVYPEPLKTKVKLVAVSRSVLEELLNLDVDIVKDEKFVEFVSGNYVPDGITPLSHRYGGHQFGDWAGQLGDGRAVMLGEFTSFESGRWELQLKGSGKTPYSRRGDGRAVLRSSVREFLCSEALYHLGVPTSRAASLVVSDDPVIRDQFYNGNIRTERAAVVLRLSPSWFRIGSLEILTQNGEIRLLRKLVDYVIDQYFHDITAADKNKYLAFFSSVVSQTAEMIAMWQSVGFAHGVCNTDNFSLLSITIDFGPFGFLDKYDPRFIPNTSDDDGRYSYGKQPDIGLYNLEKLREALLPLFGKRQKRISQDILKGYAEHYKQYFMYLFGRKLGLDLRVNEDDENLVAVLLKMMEETGSDYTMTFRQLGEVSVQDLFKQEISPNLWAIQTVKKHDWFRTWVKVYIQTLKSQGVSDSERRAKMQKANPRYVLRNWIAQSAISSAEKNDFSYINTVFRVLEQPFTEQNEAEELGFSQPPPNWASSLKVSCSS